MADRLQDYTRELELSRAALLDMIAGVEQAELDRPPAAEGAWGMGEVLHHMILVESGIARLVAKRIAGAGNELPPDTGGPGFHDLWATFPDVADGNRLPASDETFPTHGLPRAALIEGLEQARSGLRAAIRSGAGRDLSSLTHPHHLRGDLDLYHWLIVAVWHERRHTLQIQRLRGVR